MKAEAKAKAKKTAAKSTSAAGADGEKKKRKKSRKETWSSYVYKGTYLHSELHGQSLKFGMVQSSSRSTPTRVSPTRLWPSSTLS